MRMRHQRNPVVSALLIAIKLTYASSEQNEEVVDVPPWKGEFIFNPKANTNTKICCF